MDIVTYALSKKYADSIASDITNITTDGNEIYFTTSGGTTFTVTLNSVASLNVSASGHLIVTLTNGDTIDAGALPVGTMDTALSTTSENGVQNKVITAALGTKQNTLTAGTAITIDNTDPAAPVISANNDYTNLINKPTALSAFTNDQGFITNTVNNLTNYYLKTATYSAAEIDTLISNLHSLTVEIVETLPTQDISTHTIYLVNITGTNNYNQWMYINNEWSNIGSTSVDLTNYYTKGQTDTLLDSKVDKVTGYGLSQENFTSAYKDQLDNYTVDTILNAGSSNPIANSAVTDGLATKQNKALTTALVIDGTTTTNVEAALGNLNAYANKKLTITSTIPVSPSNGDVILYTGTSTADYKQGGIYQYQVSEWVIISANSDPVTKYNYSMDGTASLENDIKTFVTALIALGANTYAGYFNRSGNLGTAGNYCITVYAKEGTSTFASGYIVFGAGAMGKTQYIVSYYKPTSSSEEWTIKKLVTPEDLTNIPFGDYQLQVGGDNYAWFDLGTSTSTSNSQAFLFYEITYGRIDGGQSKIFVSCSGTMADLNYIKVVNLNGVQTSAAEQLKLDSNKHIWLGMQSYCYAHVKVYGRWTGMGSKTTIEPIGTVIPIYKLVTQSDMNTYAKPHIYEVSGGAYPTLQTLFDELVTRLKADAVGNNYGICFMGTWTGKSFFEGSFYTVDGHSSYFKITFQNPQDSKSLYTGYTGYSDTHVTYTGVA